ncbi:MAG TPA: M13 family metallopeptidase [Methylocella sp.]|nr:M13 family metallopeptidase [Methylocella sp.]
MLSRLGKTILLVSAVLLPASLSIRPHQPGIALAEVLPPGACAVTGTALAAAQTASDEGAPGLDLASLDRSVSPCTDFYQFADGGWIKANPIPADHTRWYSFDVLQQQDQVELRSILEDAAANPTKHPEANWQKIGDFYASCMNEAQIEAAGTKALDSEFAKIAAIHDVKSLETAMAQLDRVGLNAVFELGARIDITNSSAMIASANQGGLGLPDRDYYLKTDTKSQVLREEYVAHVTNMFKLLGDAPSQAAKEAHTVLAIETQLAQASMSRVDLRDPNKSFHKMSLAEAQALTPHFSWAAYIETAGSPEMAKVDSLDIAEPDFFKAADGMLESTPIADWKTYLRWHLVHVAATSLPKAFVDEDFSFNGKTLTGAQQLQPRWQRCVQNTDLALGEALGQYYVKQFFPPEAKERALVMVHNLIAALREDLQTLDWMSPATRQQAIAKLDAMGVKIGYPDKWRDYSGYNVTREAYVLNAMRGAAFNHAYNLGKVGKPVDRSEWRMTPPTVNAYYQAAANDINFPAGILQPPFFNPKADDAVNYGAIGAVIGHEMTHGFDDEGAKFDAKGNLHNWWTPEDYANFQARGECIVKEFDGFQVEPGLNENGKLVEGESIADLGGLVIAYRAFRKSLEGNPRPAPIDGFTAEQRFFLSYGRVWGGSARMEEARVLVATDPHPLPQFRLMGAVSNMPEFQKAFGCGSDSAMARPDAVRCRIW